MYWPEDLTGNDLYILAVYENAIAIGTKAECNAYAEKQELGVYEITQLDQVDIEGRNYEQNR